MSDTIGSAGAASMLAWNSDRCPSCGNDVVSAGARNIRVTAAMPEIVSYPLCEACQDRLDSGDSAEFGAVVHAAETSVKDALLEVDIRMIEQARKDGEFARLVH